MRKLKLQALMLMLEFSESLAQLHYGHLSLFFGFVVVRLHELLLKVA